MLDDYRKFFSRILCINVSFVSSDYDISRVYIMKNHPLRGQRQYHLNYSQRINLLNI